MPGRPPSVSPDLLPFFGGGWGGPNWTFDHEGRLLRRVGEELRPDTYTGFRLRWQDGRQTGTSPLHAQSSGSEGCRWELLSARYPCMHLRILTPDACPIRVELRIFSPQCPPDTRACALPIQILLFDLINATDRKLTFSLLGLLSGEAADIGTPAFELQHDNLCLCGSLGSSEQANRLAIAIPDWHSRGDVRQGVEAWDTRYGPDALLTQFDAEGVIEPSDTTPSSGGAAAWVTAPLLPESSFTVPFVLVWHAPVQEDASYRAYTTQLGRLRPDNAVVWLAEQALDDFGEDRPNWEYWLQDIEDAHANVQNVADWNALGSKLSMGGLWPMHAPLPSTCLTDSEHRLLTRHWHITNGS